MIYPYGMITERAIMHAMPPPLLSSSAGISSPSHCLVVGAVASPSLSAVMQNQLSLAAVMVSVGAVCTVLVKIQFQMKASGTEPCDDGNGVHFSFLPACQRKAAENTNFEQNFAFGAVQVACYPFFRDVFLARGATLKGWLFVVFRIGFQS